MKSLYKIKKLYFPYIILFSLFTVFQGWIPHWGGFVLLFLFIGFLLYFNYNGHNGPQKIYYAFISYLFVVICNVICGDTYWSGGSGSFYTITSNSLMILISLLYLNFLIKRNYDIIKSDYLIRTVFIIIFFSTISTAILSISNPQAIRYAMVENNIYDNSTLLQRFYRLGMSNYNLPHALPVIIPPLVLCCKKRALPPNKRIFALVAIILCMFLIYYSGAMTALLLGLFALLGSFLISTKSDKNFIRLLISFLLFSPFILQEEYLFDLLRSLGNSIGENNYFYARIGDIEESLKDVSTSGDIGARSDLYNVSWDAFLSHYFIGTNKEVGGHSTILDTLATLGIIGFIPFALLLVLVYKWTKSLLPRHSAYYSLGFFIGILMLCLKSMNNIEMWFCLFCFLPVLTYRYSRT